MTDSRFTREALLSSGWRQGSLLPKDAGVVAPAIAHHEIQAVVRAAKAVQAAARAAAKRDTPLTGPVPWIRSLGEGDRLVVITQDCDIVKVPDVYACVEVAKASLMTDATAIGNAARKTSAANFCLTDPNARPVLVVDVRLRAFIEKGFLVAHAPDNSVIGGMPDERARDFATWLGLRYSRPAVPEDDSNTIVVPLRDGWKALDDDTERKWNERFAELRFTHRDGRLTLIAVAHEPIYADDADGLELLDWMADQVRPYGHTDPSTYLTSMYTMTRAEEYESVEVDLSWASYEESLEETEAA